MDRCGEASAPTKFLNSAQAPFVGFKKELLDSLNHKAVAGQTDEGAEYFEFKGLDKQFEQTFENAFARATAFEKVYGQATEFERVYSRPATCPWKQQFQWKSEFAASNWKEEFQMKPESWVSEFKGQLEEDVQMAETAKEMLRTMDLSDPKLANSQFVAYLKGLSAEARQTCPVMHNTSHFESWKQEYRQSIAPLVTEEEDLEWERMQKDWNTFQSQGLGYEGWAKERLQQYQWSVPTSANPYSSLADKTTTANALMADLKVKDAVLCLEALVAENPQNAVAWYQLGAMQQANEMDLQAIPALFKAVKLDPQNSAAWLLLAASCANETCIPDALDAIVGWLSTKGVQQNRDIQSLIAAAKQLNDPEVPQALSILYSLSGDAESAMASLGNPVDPLLQNRLGALLANNRQYSEAETVYQRLLSKYPGLVRCHYNRGIAFMCQSRYEEALGCFQDAIRVQLPVDVVTGMVDELSAGYQAIWDSASACAAALNRDDLAQAFSQRILLK